MFEARTAGMLFEAAARLEFFAAYIAFMHSSAIN